MKRKREDSGLSEDPVSKRARCLEELMQLIDDREDDGLDEDLKTVIDHMKFVRKEEVKELADEEATWKPIPGFGRYELSSTGKIRNTKTGNVLHKGRLGVKARDDDDKVKSLRPRKLLLTIFPDTTPRDGEEWRTAIEGWPYEVSSYGRVRSTRHGTKTLLNPGSNSTGYLQAKLSRTTKENPWDLKCIQVHRLVADAFLPPPTEKGMVVDHINGIKQDNRVANLRWATYRQNSAFAKGKKMEAVHVDTKERICFNSKRDAIDFINSKWSPGDEIFALWSFQRDLDSERPIRGYMWKSLVAD